MDIASVLAPAGANAMLEEPSDHSAPGPVPVPFNAGPPMPSIEGEPGEAIEPPASIATVAAPAAEVPPVRIGISQLRSDTARNPAPALLAPESVTDCMVGGSAGAVPG